MLLVQSSEKNQGVCMSGEKTAFSVCFRDVKSQTFSSVFLEEYMQLVECWCFSNTLAWGIVTSGT